MYNILIENENFSFFFFFIKYILTLLFRLLSVGTYENLTVLSCKVSPTPSSWTSVF